MTWMLLMVLPCWNLLFVGHMPSPATAAKDLGLIISISKTEYMAANCHPHLTLQVFGESINLVHFKYLCSKLVSVASDLIRHKAVEYFFRKLKPLWSSSLWHILCKSRLILNHLCDHSPLWMLILGLITRYGINAFKCYLLLRVYAQHKTRRSFFKLQHIQSLGTSFFSQGRACQYMPSTYHLMVAGDLNVEAPLNSYLAYIQSIIYGIWRMHDTSGLDSQAWRRSLSMEKSSSRLLRTRMMMMMHNWTLIFKAYTIVLCPCIKVTWNLCKLENSIWRHLENMWTAIINSPKICISAPK